MKNIMIRIIKWVGVFFLIFIMALGLLGCGGGQGYNPPVTGNVEGTVTDEADVAIAGAVVVLEEADLSAVTDADGYYILENIPVGTYNFAASADLYYPQTTTVTVEQDKTLARHVMLQAIQIYTLPCTVSGTITDKDTEVLLEGATVTIEGTGWSATTEEDGSYSISDVEASTYIITASKLGYSDRTETVTVDGDTTVDFELIALVLYDLIIDSSAGVSVTTPGEGTFAYDDGTVVELVAEVEYGYRFVEWTGDVDTISDVGTAATNITMSGNYRITATAIAVFDLTISSTEGGSVAIPGEGTFGYDAGTVVELVVEASDGYQFVEWTGDVDTISDVTAVATNITMSGNYSITASFEEIEVDLAPAVYSLEPNTASPKTQLTVIISGANFQNGAIVDFGNKIVVQGVTFISNSELEVNINVQNKAIAGPRNVTVTNPNGQSGTLVAGFNVL
jgi:hypothetical protein